MELLSAAAMVPCEVCLRWIRAKKAVNGACSRCAHIRDKFYGLSDNSGCVAVGRSRLKNVQHGLFVIRRVVTNQRIASFGGVDTVDNIKGVYVVQLRKNQLYRDGDPALFRLDCWKQGLAQFANRHCEGHPANAALIVRGGDAYLRATKDIEPGTEVLVANYGTAHRVNVPLRGKRRVRKNVAAQDTQAKTQRTV